MKLNSLWIKFDVDVVSILEIKARTDGNKSLNILVSCLTCHWLLNPSADSLIRCQIRVLNPSLELSFGIKIGPNSVVNVESQFRSRVFDQVLGLDLDSGIGIRV